MILVEPNHQLEGAGLCFICETSIPREKMAVVDTNYNYDPPFHSNLVGRKYVCQGCAETIGYTVGMVKAQDVANVKSVLDTTKAKLQTFKDGVMGLVDSLNSEAALVLDLPVLDLPDIVSEVEPVVKPVKPEAKPKVAKTKAVTETKENESGS